jgi:enamine deaminase RidA (YjgF/YER057c/UK114 family)
MTRERFSTGTPWEPIVGYSRAVRVGNMIFVTGTTAMDYTINALVGQGDMYKQTRQCILNIELALTSLGATLSDVVRTRIFIRDITLWEEAGKAHGEFFKTILPATTMVEVSRLIHPDMLIEVEADAVITTD